MNKFSADSVSVLQNPTPSKILNPKSNTQQVENSIWTPGEEPTALNVGLF